MFRTHGQSTAELGWIHSLGQAPPHPYPLFPPLPLQSRHPHTYGPGLGRWKHEVGTPREGQGFRESFHRRPLCHIPVTPHNPPRLQVCSYRAKLWPPRGSAESLGPWPQGEGGRPTQGLGVGRELDSWTLALQGPGRLDMSSSPLHWLPVLFSSSSFFLG